MEPEPGSVLRGVFAPLLSSAAQVGFVEFKNTKTSLTFFVCHCHVTRTPLSL